jgi:UDP-N-acetylmuramoylalanine--D-glutamate ligase
MSFHATLEALKSSQSRVLVVGLGISGIESAKFLATKGLHVAVCERQAEEVFAQRSKYAASVGELRKAGVDLHFGIDGEGIAPLLRGAGLVVLSPGVPLESPLVATIIKHNLPFVSELELGIELHGGRSIVVTGSNGKSTTATLLDHVLHHAGVHSHLCGNVGTPVIANDEISDEITGERAVLVVEASSYQLEACSVLKPCISVMLNISENHLERHGTIERYAAAKARAFALQDADDYIVANADDPLVLSQACGARGILAVFGQQPEQDLSKLSKTWAHFTSEPLLRVAIDGAREEYDLTTCHLLGIHNRYNIAAVVLAARRLGVSPAAVQKGLESFHPLEHRLEPVSNTSGFRIFNDSKSTTVAAAVAAFRTIRSHYPTNQIVVMIGGLSKAGSWEPLLALLKEHRAALLPIVCFGKDGQMLASLCDAADLPTRVDPTLRAATEAGVSMVRESPDAILVLTPGCASFDEFTDFEHRGAEFKRFVRELC